MVRVKEKKAKGDDAFKTRKQKVGRKKLAPATTTRAEVHARTLRITAPHQALQTPAEQEQHMRDAKDARRPPRTFKEEMAATGHYRAPTKRGAFQALAKIVAGNAKGQSTCSPLQLLQLVSTALEAMTENEREVREGVEAALLAVLDVPGAVAGPLPPLILSNMLIVLTHANIGVRRCGMRFVGRVLEKAPGTFAGLLDVPGTDVAQVVDDLRLIVRHVADLSPKGTFRELSLLLQELNSTAVLADDYLLALYDHLVGFLATAWKECMELKHALFRNADLTVKAISIAEILHVIVRRIDAAKAMNNTRLRRLKDLLVSQVPFTQADLASSSSVEARDFALSLAKAQSTLSVVPECFAAVMTFLREALGTHKHRNYRLALGLLLELVNDKDRCDSCSSLLDTFIPSFQQCLGEGASTIVVHSGCRVIRCFFSVCPSSDYGRRLASVIERIPRLLFAARATRELDAAHVAGELLEVLWQSFSQSHPAVAFVDQRKFAISLTSVFGFQGSQGATVPGVASLCTPDVVQMAASIFTLIDLAALPPEASLPSAVKEAIAVQRSFDAITD